MASVAFEAILVADGSEIVRHLLRRLLAPHAREVRAAARVDEALELAARGACDLMLADVTLPGGGAMELLQALSNAPDPRPGVVAMSLRPSIDEESRLSVAGALGYLEKPITHRNLARIFKALACRIDAAGAERLHCHSSLRAVVIDENGRDAVSWEVRDWSDSGAFLLTQAPLPLGSELRLELRSGAIHCSVCAEVVRVQEPAWGRLPGVAVAFRRGDAQELERFGALRARLEAAQSAFAT